MCHAFPSLPSLFTLFSLSLSLLPHLPIDRYLSHTSPLEIVCKEASNQGFKQCTNIEIMMAPRTLSQTEERQDMYVVVSNSVGAKLRGDESTAGGIEVKRRQERKKRGAELWEKVHKNPLPSTATLPPSLPPSLTHSLTLPFSLSLSLTHTHSLSLSLTILISLCAWISLTTSCPPPLASNT
jgi:hypothetical protein